MKLITETIDKVKYLSEESENGNKKLFIEGTFLVGERVNKNNRMYKMDTLRKEVQRYTEEYIKTNRALGELGHPDTPSINLERVSHKIVSLSEDGNTFYGKALILDTPYGQIVKNFIDNDIQVGVSSRALGSLMQTKEGYNLVQDDLRLATAADIVADPSAPGAFVNGIMENTEYYYDITAGNWKIAERLEETVKELKKEVSYKKPVDEAKALRIFENFIASLK